LPGYIKGPSPKGSGFCVFAVVLPQCFGERLDTRN
jgi:hypothetical protein